MAVFVLDKCKRPLMPCSEKRARLLLEGGRARIHRIQPFTIRLIDRRVAESATQPVVVKIDPGSRNTGIAVARIKGGERHIVLSLIELHHRGQRIRAALQARSAHRRFRRARLRYRPARFKNRTRAKGWLPPSLQHRIDTTRAWVERLRRFAPVTEIAVERARFDTYLLHVPNALGIDYHQGELAGYEVREYLLEKWKRRCAYCDATSVPLQVEHVVSRARGGSDRISNLAIACHPCNQAKGAQPIETFITNPARLARIVTQLKAPLQDAAAMNATRHALYKVLVATGLLIEASTGGRTKFNRSRLGIPKSHALDAACVGTVADVDNWQQPTLVVTATGRGAYQRTRLDRHGFPRGYLTRKKRLHGFATGDLVQANVPRGKYAGVHRGRVAVRAKGAFLITCWDGVARDIGFRHCRLLQRGDGYSYRMNPIIADFAR